MYPSEQALQKPEVKAFIAYYLENVNSVAESLGFVPLTEEQLDGIRSSRRKDRRLATRPDSR